MTIGIVGLLLCGAIFIVITWRIAHLLEKVDYPKSIFDLYKKSFLEHLEAHTRVQEKTMMVPISSYNLKVSDIEQLYRELIKPGIMLEIDPLKKKVDELYAMKKGISQMVERLNKAERNIEIAQEDLYAIKAGRRKPPTLNELLKAKASLKKGAKF